MPLSCDHGPSPGIISPKPQEAPSRSSGVGNGPQHMADCNPPSVFGSSPLTQQCDYVPSPAPIISEPSSCNPKPSVSEHIPDPLPIPNSPLTDCILESIDDPPELPQKRRTQQVPAAAKPNLRESSEVGGRSPSISLDTSDLKPSGGPHPLDGRVTKEVCSRTPSNKSDPTPKMPAESNYEPPEVHLIGAVPFHRLVSDGDTFYGTLHIRPYTAPPVSLRATSDSAPQSEQDIIDEILPKEYHDFADVFSKSHAKQLPPHRPYDHTIEIEEGAKIPYGSIYNMSEIELTTLREFIDDMMGKGFIRPSNSPAGAPVLFARSELQG